MDQLVLLPVCLLGGLLLRRVPGFPPDAARGLNAFIIHVSLPAITLRYIPVLEIGWALLYPVAMSWIVFLVAWPLFMWWGRWMKWSRATVGCLVLVAGLGNTSFVGFPFIAHYYGEAGLQIAVLCDQPGAFLVLATLGMLALSYFGAGDQPLRAGSILGQVLRFPPFVAFLLSLLLIPLAPLPAVVTGVLDKLGATLTPLALVSVGLQLRWPGSDFPFPALGLGLLYKLLLAPLLILGLYRGLAGQSGLAIDVSILEAAMAPMITPSILAMERGLDPPLASILVGAGIPLSLLTVAGWYAFIG
ncbi:MAG: AEC family transporter [Bacteroidia bacterium]